MSDSDLTARARAVLAEDRAMAMLGAARFVASETAWEVIGFVAVGERHISERHDLPSWSYDIDGERIVPTQLARDVVEHPATHAAALSPGMRREIVEPEPFFDEGEALPPVAIGPVSSQYALGSLTRVTGGWTFTLNARGREVARLLADPCERCDAGSRATPPCENCPRRADARYDRSECENCGSSTQHIDMGRLPTGERVCGFCLRLYPHHAEYGTTRRARLLAEGSAQ